MMARNTQLLVGFRPREGERVWDLRWLFHVGLHEYAAWIHGEVQYLSGQLTAAERGEFDAIMAASHGQPVVGR